MKTVKKKETNKKLIIFMADSKEEEFKMEAHFTTNAFEQAIFFHFRQLYFKLLFASSLIIKTIK